MHKTNGNSDNKVHNNNKLLISIHMQIFCMCIYLYVVGYVCKCANVCTYGLLLQSVNILKGKEKIKLLQAKIFGLNHNVNSMKYKSLKVFGCLSTSIIYSVLFLLLLFAIIAIYGIICGNHQNISSVGLSSEQTNFSSSEPGPWLSAAGFSFISS